MNKSNDLNSALAFCVIPLIFVVAWFFSLSGTIDQNSKALGEYFNHKGYFISVAISLNIVISAFILWGMATVLGIGKFGGKILQFRQNRSKLSSNMKIAMTCSGLMLGFILLGLTFYFRPYENFRPLPSVVPVIQGSLLFYYLLTRPKVF